MRGNIKINNPINKKRDLFKASSSRQSDLKTEKKRKREREREID